MYTLTTYPPKVFVCQMPIVIERECSARGNIEGVKHASIPDTLLSKPSPFMQNLREQPVLCFKRIASDFSKADSDESSWMTAFGQGMAVILLETSKHTQQLTGTESKHGVTSNPDDQVKDPSIHSPDVRMERMPCFNSVPCSSLRMIGTDTVKLGMLCTIVYIPWLACTIGRCSSAGPS